MYVRRSLSGPAAPPPDWTRHASHLAIVLYKMPCPPNAPVCIRTHPNASKCIRTGPNGSSNIQTPPKTKKTFLKNGRKKKKKKIVRGPAALPPDWTRHANL